MSWTWLNAKELAPQTNTRLKALERSLTSLEHLVRGVALLDDGDTTPSVRAARVVRTLNSGATSITAFEDGESGQHLTVFFGDNATTLVHGTNLRLSGATNFTGSTGDIRQFVCFDSDNGTSTFREVPQG